MEKMNVIEIPASPQCAKILAQREHVLIGVSACVGYYTVERIAKLIEWGKNNFNSYQVLLSGKKPLYVNFEALGKKRAQYRASQHANSIYNKVKKAFLLADPKIKEDKKIIIIDQFLENDKYMDVYSKVLKKYHEDTNFRKQCRASTRLVLKSKTNEITNTMIDIASNYLLWELPFYIDTPKILSVDTSLLVYHKEITFFTNLYKNRDNAFVVEKQGHLIVHF
jgi:tRNA-dependent cyclodipeptide synthase